MKYYKKWLIPFAYRSQEDKRVLNSTPTESSEELLC